VNLASASLKVSRAVCMPSEPDKCSSCRTPVKHSDTVLGSSAVSNTWFCSSSSGSSSIGAVRSGAVCSMQYSLTLRLGYPAPEGANDAYMQQSYNHETMPVCIRIEWSATHSAHRSAMRTNMIYRASVDT
jgi:hypothetical protein